MSVKVVLYARSRRLPHIYADIKATGGKYLPQDLDTAADYFKMLVPLFLS